MTSLGMVEFEAPRRFAGARSYAKNKGSSNLKRTDSLRRAHRLSNQPTNSLCLALVGDLIKSA